MNRWTRYLGGGSKDDDANRPLLPESDPPSTSQSAPSAPPYGAPAGDPDFPEPVKPGTSHSYQNQAPPPAYQAHSSAYPAPSYAQQQHQQPPPPYVADGYPLPHAMQPPVYDAPPLIVNRELVVLEPLRGSHVVVACPHCGHTGRAAVSKESGFVTYFSSFLLCFLGCCILSIFPFCSDCTKDWVYRCARCGTLFGRERP